MRGQLAWGNVYWTGPATGPARARYPCHGPAAQPLLTALFTRKVKQARAHRAARLDASRDGIVNYLPAKLFGEEWRAFHEKGPSRLGGIARQQGPVLSSKRLCWLSHPTAATAAAIALTGMERTMCQLAMAQRRLEECCLLVAYGAYAFVCANQLFLPAVVTTIASERAALCGGLGCSLTAGGLFCLACSAC